MNSPSSNPQAPNPQVQAFFDPATWTVSYVVYDHDGGAAAIVDSVLDYDPKSGRTRTTSADKVIAFVRQRQLQVQWILETHAHADHLSAAPYLRQQLGGQVAIGAQITGVQKVFKGIFHMEPEFSTDGRQFDHLFADGERFAIGAGSHPRLRGLPVRRRGVRGRHTVHAGRGNRPLRLSRRRCAHPVRLDPKAAEPAPRHPPVHVP